MDDIDWSNDPGDTDGTEDPATIGHIEAQRMSVGEAYRSLQFFPDFVVLWQIRRRWTAVILAALYAGLLGSAAIAAFVQSALAIGAVVVLFLVAVAASLYVLFALENWVIEFNETVDDELRRVMGRR